MTDRFDGFYTYKETRHSGRGIAATVMGILSLLALLVLVVASGVIGNLGELAGAVGFTAFALAFVGMVMGLKSFSDTCRSYIFCKIGTVLCGLMVAFWFLIFCFGLAG